MKRLENEGPEEKRWMVEKKEKRISHKNAVLSTFWGLFLLISKKECETHLEEVEYASYFGVIIARKTQKCSTK